MPCSALRTALVAGGGRDPEELLMGRAERRREERLARIHWTKVSKNAREIRSKKAAHAAKEAALAAEQLQTVTGTHQEEETPQA